MSHTSCTNTPHTIQTPFRCTKRCAEVSHSSRLCIRLSDNQCGTHQPPAGPLYPPTSWSSIPAHQLVPYTRPPAGPLYRPTSWSPIPHPPATSWSPIPHPPATSWSPIPAHQLVPYPPPTSHQLVPYFPPTSHQLVPYTPPTSRQLPPYSLLLSALVPLEV